MVLRERLSDIREVIHMTIREELEKMERETLSPYATLSVNTKGRERENSAMSGLFFSETGTESCIVRHSGG